MTRGDVGGAALQPKPRVMRVFISSTFEDMKLERDELVKLVFPRVREVCESRGVTWGEVDLRWGVTDEQRAEGSVLPVCLEEVRSCRPYFVGLLGERYGWVPEQFGPELIAQEPWLEAFAGRSVTELEILGGVLRNPEMARHACFYLRDPSAASKPELHEMPRDDEIRRLGLPEAIRRAEQRKQRLAELKDRIRRSGFPVREGYTDAAELGKLVLDDLLAVVDEVFPAGSELEEGARDEVQQIFYARARTSVYVRREAYFEPLDDLVSEGRAPVVVVGEAGSGKSALLANWIIHREAVAWGERPPVAGERAAHVPLLVHFVGASPASSDWMHMLGRLTRKLGTYAGVAPVVSDDPDGLRAQFAQALRAAAARGTVIVVIDGLDQLEDQQGARSLVWMPRALPAGARLVVSTRPGESLNELLRRGAKTLPIEPLAGAERRQLVSAYLADYGKSLSPERVELISASRQCSNPLYLRTVLDELRLYGDHTTLPRQLDALLQASDVQRLYEIVLRRYEEDYERDRPGLVRESMSLLWAARRGLTETELLELLGDSNGPLPSAYWSPLRLGVVHTVTEHGGLLSFAHDHFRRAVEAMYLTRNDARRGLHRQLAHYFLGSSEYRRLDEAPWQLEQANEWELLRRVLADQAFFVALSRSAPFELRRYWTRLKHEGFRLADSYRQLLAAPAENLDAASRLAALLEHHDPPAALSLWSRVAQSCRERGDSWKLVTALSAVAELHYHRGDYDGAQATNEEHERICRAQEDLPGLVNALSLKAELTDRRGDPEAALALWRQGEDILRSLGDLVGATSCLANQAVVYRRLGQLDRAMEIHREQERVARETGDLDLLAVAVGNQALILHDTHDDDAALVRMREQERIAREISNADELQQSLSRQASVHLRRGENSRAVELLAEAERTCREQGLHEGLLQVLGKRTTIALNQADYDEALMLVTEQERLSNDLGDLVGMRAVVRNRASIAAERRQAEQELEHRIAEERLSIKLDDPAGTYEAIIKQGLIAWQRLDLEKALERFVRAEEVGRAAGLRDRLATALGNQAMVRGELGSTTEALALYREQARISRETGDDQQLLLSLRNQTVLQQSLGEFALADALLDEQERLSRAGDHLSRFSDTLIHLAEIRKRDGDIAQAVNLRRREAQMRIEVNDRDGRAAAVKALGSLLVQQGSRELDAGRPTDGLRLLYEAEEFLREANDTSRLAWALGTLAIATAQTGDSERALALHAEAEQLFRDMGAWIDVATAVGHQAELLAERGALREALARREEQARIGREHDNAALVARAVGFQADLRLSLEDHAGALRCAVEEERLLRSLGRSDEIAPALCNQGWALAYLARLDAAVSKLEQAAVVYREQGDERAADDARHRADAVRTLGRQQITRSDG